MSHQSQFSVGQRVKVVGPAQVHEDKYPNPDVPMNEHIKSYMGWGTIEPARRKGLIKVRIDGKPFAIHYRPENLLDYFTAICQDAIDDVSK